MLSKTISRYGSAHSTTNVVQSSLRDFQQVKSNSRASRRSVKRRWLRSLICGAGLAAASLGLAPSVAKATPPSTFDVTDSATFAFALSSAHSGDVINILNDFTMTQSVAAINTDLTINGNGHTIDGNNAYRPFFIASGTVAIADLAIENGQATGGTGGAGYRGGGGGMGAGGAIFVNSGAAVTLSGVDFVSNGVQGGNGMASTIADGGGGGGGMDENGANRIVASTDGANGGGANGGAGGVGISGGAGGDFGGGGGAGLAAGSGGPYNGGSGGFGGGGGGASGNDDDAVGDGGNGGFGGGGGGGGGFGGTGGGDGSEFGGGGGAGFGGAVFIREGGSVTIQSGSFSGGTTLAGSGSSGASSGSTAGSGIYLNNVSANFDIADGETMTIDDAIGGDSSGSIRKQGTGTLVLNGTNTFTGNSDVETGLLVINGSSAGDLMIHEDATLGGTGTLNGHLDVYGKLAPGNSIGTLTVNGYLFLTHTSVTEIEIRPSASPVAGTDNDLIVVDHDALIFGGNTVAVKAAPGSYVDGAVYTFLTADFILGGYDTITDDLAFFDAVLGHTSNEYYFTLVSVAPDFIDLGKTRNQRAVGSYIDANFVGASGDFEDILVAFQSLTHEQAQDALSQLSGEVHGSGAQVMVNGTNQMLGTIGQQLRGSMSPSQGSGGGIARSSSRGAGRQSDSSISLVSYESSGSTCDEWVASTCRDTYAWRAWTLGYGLGGSAESDGNAAGIHYGLGGTTTGIERFVSDHTRLGAFGGYVGSQVTLDGADQSSQANGGNFGAYLTHDCGLRYGMLMGGMQFDGYESQRTIEVGGLTRTAEGESDGWQGFAYGEQGLNLNLSRGMNLQPFAGLQYVYARQNAFTETGAGAMNLDVSGIDTNSLRSMLGSRLQFQSRSTNHGWIVTPEVRSSWMHEFLDTTSIVNAQFAGVGGAGFTANGLDLGRDWAILGTGLAARPSDRWELRADYNSQFNDRQALHIGSGTVSYWW